VIADVILATGRTPNVENWVWRMLGDVVPSAIEGPGYSTTNAIAVNEYSQTSQPNILL